MHVEVANYAKAKNVKQLLVVSEYAEAMANAFGPAAKKYSEMTELLAEIDSVLGADVVLVKGSRSTGMERVVHHLQKHSQKGEH